MLTLLSKKILNFFKKNRYIIVLFNEDGKAIQIKTVRTRNIKQAQRKAINFLRKHPESVFFDIKIL